MVLLPSDNWILLLGRLYLLLLVKWAISLMLLEMVEHKEFLWHLVVLINSIVSVDF